MKQTRELPLASARVQEYAPAAPRAELGVVRRLLQPPRGGADSTAKLIGLVQAGLPVAELEVLRTALALPMEALAPRLGISRATLQRRKTQGRLGPAESDVVVRFARLLGQAVEVFEGNEAARRWLQAPQAGLGGEVPLDYAMTEIGAREVEALLGRIDHGVYS